MLPWINPSSKAVDVLTSVSFRMDATDFNKIEPKIAVALSTIYTLEQFCLSMYGSQSKEMKSFKWIETLARVSVLDIRRAQIPKEVLMRAARV